jgi:hypothetical protein
VIIHDSTRITTEHLMFLGYCLVADVTHLDHPLRTDRARSGGRLHVLNKRIILFLFGIRTTIQQAYAAGRIFQGTSITDKSRSVQSGRLSLPQSVVPLVVRHPLRLERLPLFNEVLLAVGAGLDSARRVDGPRPARPGVFDQAGKKRLHRGVGKLLGGDHFEAAAGEAVPAHVAHLRRRVLIRHAQVEDVRPRRRVGVLIVENRKRLERGLRVSQVQGSFRDHLGVLAFLTHDLWRPWRYFYFNIVPSTRGSNVTSHAILII